MKVARGPAAAELVEQGWRVFLVKVHNEGGRDRAAASHQPQRRAAATSARPAAPSRSRPSSPRTCPTAGWTCRRSTASRSTPSSRAWSSNTASCSSTAATRASAKRSSASTSARGRRTSAFATRWTILFECEPAVRVKLVGARRRRQADDRAVRVPRQARAASIPSQSRRLAPDFFFHDQIYRARRRRRAAAAGRVRSDVQPRAGVSCAEEDDHRARRGRASRVVPR